MVTSKGSASLAITGGKGLDIPLVPRVLSDREVEARRHREAATIEAAEAAAARAAKPTSPPHRRRRGEKLSMPTSVPRPTPAPEPEVLDKPEVPAAAVAEPETPEAAVTPGFDIDAPTQIRQLRTELAMAGQRITTLLTQVEEQGACITSAFTDLEKATSIAAQLSELAAEQQQLLTARAETAEKGLKTAHRQIAALLTELSAPAEAADDSDQQVEAVLCLGAGCGLPVAPEYVASTGYLWHGPCKDRVQAAARLSDRRVA